jgi:predicted porin
MAPGEQLKKRCACATEGALAAAIVAICCSAPARGYEHTAGDWTLKVNGNVNVFYILADCEDETEPAITGGLACRGAAGENRSSSVANGLLPAALAVSVATTQKSYDLSVNFGFFPGIATNDGSPNLQQGATALNTPLGTTAIDMRQVFLTFGNDRMGTFKLGRDIGLFGGDAILNDMTIRGVGAVNTNNAAPANTALGSIGLGYIYADWYGQIDYTTRDFNGFKLTVGIFDPEEPITQPAPTPERDPGFQAKLAYTGELFYLSAAYMHQTHKGLTDAGDFDSNGFDVGGKVTFGPGEFFVWYYNGRGMGTTALYLFGATDTGAERDSDGFLTQFTWKVGETKLGLNYGRSNLDLADGEAPSALVMRNEKYTLGAYHSLTPNLTLLAELTKTRAEAHNGIENESNNFNIGAYLSF